MAKTLGYEDGVEEMRMAFQEISDVAKDEFTKFAKEAQKRNINIEKEFLEQASTG
jgi:hypothetical protein